MREQVLANLSKKKYLDTLLENIVEDALCFSNVWSAECLSWSIMTRAQAPRQTIWPSICETRCCFMTTASSLSDAVVVLEDDFDFAPDLLEYFAHAKRVLDADSTLWLASAWNDNGFRGLVRDPLALRRTQFFPGLGWLLTRRLWEEELREAWPETHWDHWMRNPTPQQQLALEGG